MYFLYLYIHMICIFSLFYQKVISISFGEGLVFFFGGIQRCFIKRPPETNHRKKKHVKIGYLGGGFKYALFKTGWRLWPPTRVIHINLRQKVHSNEVAVSKYETI